MIYGCIMIAIIWEITKIYGCGLIAKLICGYVTIAIVFPAAIISPFVFFSNIIAFYN